MADKNKAKIKIVKNGPYCVFGSIPLKEKIITPVGDHYQYRQGRKLDQADTYSLCRCAYLRFCHTEKGTTWELLDESDKKEERELLKKSAEECLAGRLTAVKKICDS